MLFILESSCISVLFVTSNCVGALQELMHNLSPFYHQVMLISLQLPVHSASSHIHMYSCYAYQCTSCCFCLLINSTHHSRLKKPLLHIYVSVVFLVFGPLCKYFYFFLIRRCASRVLKKKKAYLCICKKTKYLNFGLISFHHRTTGGNKKTKPKRLKWKIIPSKQENHSFLQSRVLFSGNTILNLFRQQQQQVSMKESSFFCMIMKQSVFLSVQWLLMLRNSGFV